MDPNLRLVQASHLQYNDIHDNFIGSAVASLNSLQECVFPDGATLMPHKLKHSRTVGWLVGWIGPPAECIGLMHIMGHEQWIYTMSWGGGGKE